MLEKDKTYLFPCLVEIRESLSELRLRSLELMGELNVDLRFLDLRDARLELLVSDLSLWL